MASSCLIKLLKTLFKFYAIMDKHDRKRMDKENEMIGVAWELLSKFSSISLKIRGNSWKCQPVNWQEGRGYVQIQLGTKIEYFLQQLILTSKCMRKFHLYEWMNLDKTRSTERWRLIDNYYRVCNQCHFP